MFVKGIGLASLAKNRPRKGKRGEWGEQKTWCRPILRPAWSAGGSNEVPKGAKNLNNAWQPLLIREIWNVMRS